MFRLIALIVVVVAAGVRGGVVHAASGIGVQVLGVEGESLWRSNGCDWRPTENGFFETVGVGEDQPEFDLRPGGAPWFTKHFAIGDYWLDHSPAVVTVGERRGDVQEFWYGEQAISLPVVQVPEPSSWLISLLSLLTAVFIFKRKGGRDGKQASDDDGSDEAGASRLSANGHGWGGRAGVDEQRQRESD